MYTEEKARELDLTGWVRNLPSGQVEILVEGEKNRIEDMITWCRKGPPAARVTLVEAKWEVYHGDFPDFRTV